MPQRRITIESDGASLEGVLTLPDGPGPFGAVVICHPHPEYGGSMHNNVVAAVASSVVARGIAAVMFNFRGVGASDGVPGDRDEARTDTNSVLAYAAGLDEIDADRVGLAGYSFGAGTAVGVAGDALPALALVSLPLMMAEGAHDALAAFTRGRCCSSPAARTRAATRPGCRPSPSRARARRRCAWWRAPTTSGGATSTRSSRRWGRSLPPPLRAEAGGPFFASALAG